MTATNYDVSLFVGARAQCNCNGCNTHTHCEFVGEPVREIDTDLRRMQLATYCVQCISVHPLGDELQRAERPRINDLNQ